MGFTWFQPETPLGCELAVGRPTSQWPPMASGFRSKEAPGQHSIEGIIRTETAEAKQRQRPRSMSGSVALD